MDEFLTFLLIVGQCLLVLVCLLISLAFLLYMDRKVWAAVQLRRGPNVVGPWGLLQSFADFLKFVMKEIVIPAGADRTVFLLAPMITFVLAVIAWAAIPFAEGWVISDLNVGILYLFAISSLGVYGVIMGGWAANSKYPFLGGLRSAAQMVSYEVSIGFVIVTVLLMVGSLNLTDSDDVRPNDHPVFRWLVVANPRVARWRAVVRSQNCLLLLPVLDGEGDCASLSLRSADADWLEDVPAAFPRICCNYRWRHEGVRYRTLDHDRRGA